jgi:hypothetical protein
VTVADAVETAATSSLPLPSMLIWSSSFEQLCHRGPTGKQPFFGFLR